MNQRQHDAMLRTFTAFAARIAKRYDQVGDCLRAGRYEEAQILLADLAKSHAKTSMSLRGVLIRNGLLEDK
jgi:hypothetical protein